MVKNVSLQNSAMAVVFYKGRILATRENIYGKIVLSLPKGHVESGETVVETAIRECFEETNGIVTKADAVAELKPFEIHFITPDCREVIKTISPILFDVLYKGNPQPIEKRVKSVEYMDVDEFLANCSYDNVKQVVRQALDLLQINNNAQR